MSKNKRPQKPFPWTCSNCREKAVYEGAIDYEIDLERDGQTYHINLPGLKTPRCRKCGTPTLDSEANKKITAEMRRMAKLLTPGQIRKYREGLGLTKQDLAAALSTFEEIVGYWESGFLIQNRAQDNVLRLFFGLPDARDLLTKRKLNKVGLVLRDKSLAST